MHLNTVLSKRDRIPSTTLCSPDDGSDHDGLLSTHDIGDEARDQGSEPGTRGHRGSDTALDVWMRTGTCFVLGVGRTEGTLIEVAEVLMSADDGRHG